MGDLGVRLVCLLSDDRATREGDTQHKEHEKRDAT